MTAFHIEHLFNIAANCVYVDSSQATRNQLLNVYSLF